MIVLRLSVSLVKMIWKMSILSKGVCRKCVKNRLLNKINVGIVRDVNVSEKPIKQIKYTQQEIT